MKVIPIFIAKSHALLKSKEVIRSYIIVVDMEINFQVIFGYNKPGMHCNVTVRKNN